MKTLLLIMLVGMTGCTDIADVKSGSMMHIPYTSNYVIGTDSTLVIIERNSGKTVNVIHRHSIDTLTSPPTKTE